MADAVPDVKTAAGVRKCCDNMQMYVDRRARARTNINILFNGQQPWSTEEVKKYHIKKNVNWQEGTTKMLDAIRQINSAFIPAGNFFSALSNGGIPDKRPEYSQTFTNNANASLKRGKTGKTHMFVLKNRNCNVGVHGIGPMMWMTKGDLLPRYIPLEDLLIPTDTDQSFDDLMYFGVNLYPTLGQFFDMTHGERVDPGWKKGPVRRVLSDVRDLKIPGYTASDWIHRPEAAAEVFKQNRMMLDTDATARVRIRIFFHKDYKDGKWYRKVILRDSTANQSADEFLYDSNDPWAEELCEFIHVQYGDGSVVAPLKYHSVRGLGVMLFAPTWTINELRCSFVDHAQQNMQQWLRRKDSPDRDTSKVLELYNNAIIGEGWDFVKREERHQIDPRLAESSMAQMKQLMAENSSSFTTDIDTGTPKEMTAFEARARLNAASRQVASMLGMMYSLEVYYYEELVRRLCMKNPTDPAIKKFQNQCKRDGIPAHLMEASNWTIRPERVLGAGDQTLAQAIANTLFSVKSEFDPPAQKIIKRRFVAELTDPEFAKEIVPDSEEESTSGTRAAEDVFGTMMISGIPSPPRKGIDHEGYIGALLAMMGSVIQNIEGTDGMGDPSDLTGLSAVAQSIEEHIGILAMSEEKKEIVKEFSDVLGDMMNKVRAFAQRQQEAMESEQLDPEKMAKIQTDQMAAQQKMQINEAATQQKLAQKDAAFRQKMSQSQEKMVMESIQSQVKQQIEQMNAANELRMESMKAAQEMRIKELEAVVGLSLKAKSAEAGARKQE